MIAKNKRLSLIHLAVVLLLAVSNPLAAQETSNITLSHPPRIAIVIDDLGSQLSTGLRTIGLPRNGPITLAIIPFTPYGKRLAKVAYKQNNEVILHLPMEPLGEHRPHQGMLKRSMHRDALIHTLRKAVDDIPHISGFNNHMGSLLTQTPEHMQWIMNDISLNTSLFFLDSRTSSKSVAYETAKDTGIPSLKRDIFLDSIQSIEFVEKQFGKLMSVAIQQGYAIGIGHPYPETLLILEKYLPILDELGFELVSLSDILNSPTNMPYHYIARSGKAASNNETLPSDETFIYNHHAKLPEPEDHLHP